jgi:hypothetical protein
MSVLFGIAAMGGGLKTTSLARNKLGGHTMITTKNFDQIQSEYSSLLDRMTENDEDEKIMHEYLEKRQLLLPGIMGSNEKYHHGTYGGFIFSEFSLFGSFNRRPDFMFVTKNSQSILINMIEIEKPSKKYFNLDDSFTKDFSGAYQQLEDWKIWCNDSNNTNTLRTWLLEIITHHLMGVLPIKYEYTLVYGRRNEYKDNKKRINRLNEKTKDPFVVMSFDRLNCFRFSSSFVTTKRKEDGFFAVQVDPDYRYDNFNYPMHKRLKNLVDAVNANEFMEPSRKKDLIDEITKVNKMSEEEAKDYFNPLKKVMNK